MQLRWVRSLLAVIAIMTVFSLLSAAESRRHELNGTWRLVHDRCQFGDGPALDAGTVTIYDRERHIYVSENYSFQQDGQIVSYTFSADAPRNASIRSGPLTKAKAKWVGDALQVISTNGDLTTTERYSLASDGSLVLTVERSGHAPEALVFERQ